MAICVVVVVVIDCRVGEELGSGLFGGEQGEAVGGAAEVAIKTLRPESKEEEKVKFMQEAAINGQFRHPNIVRLQGVVTVGELMSKRATGRE